ncbi:hypothetical protein WH91_06750, partial [Devosia psychrophila]
GSAHPMLSAQIGHPNPTFGLAQDRQDLGFAISRHLHQNLLVHIAEKILLLNPIDQRGDYRVYAGALVGIATL